MQAQPVTSKACLMTCQIYLLKALTMPKRFQKDWFRGNLFLLPLYTFNQLQNRNMLYNVLIDRWWFSSLLPGISTRSSRDHFKNFSEKQLKKDYLAKAAAFY